MDKDNLQQNLALAARQSGKNKLVQGTFDEIMRIIKKMFDSETEIIGKLNLDFINKFLISERK